MVGGGGGDYDERVLYSIFYNTFLLQWTGILSCIAGSNNDVNLKNSFGFDLITQIITYMPSYRVTFNP